MSEANALARRLRAHAETQLAGARNTSLDSADLLERLAAELQERAVGGDVPAALKLAIFNAVPQTVTTDPGVGERIADAVLAAVLSMFATAEAARDAARKSALEEAAALCETLGAQQAFANATMMGIKCARSIRALTPSPSQSGESQEK